MIHFVPNQLGEEDCSKTGLNIEGDFSVIWELPEVCAKIAILPKIDTKMQIDANATDRIDTPHGPSCAGQIAFASDIDRKSNPYLLVYLL